MCPNIIRKDLKMKGRRGQGAALGGGGGGGSEKIGPSEIKRLMLIKGSNPYVTYEFVERIESFNC